MSFSFSFNCIFIIIAFFGVITLGHPTRDGSACQSEACRRIGSVIKNDLNVNVNPCDNFYEFSCGNYIDKAEIPAIATNDYCRGLWKHECDDSLEVSKKLEHSLNKDVTDQDTETIKKLKTFYKMCQRGDFNKSIEEKEREFLSIYNDISQVTGGWSLINKELWDSSHAPWAVSIGKFQDFGQQRNYLLWPGLERDPSSDKDDSIAMVMTPITRFPYLNSSTLSNGLESKELKDYLEELIVIAKKFNVTENNARRELTKSVQFEIELAKIQNEVDPQDEILTTFDELEKKYPAMDWYYYLGMVNHVDYKSSDRVKIYSPNSVQKVLELILRTPDEVINNYIYSRFILEVYADFQKSYTDCLKTSNSVMYMATTALYIKEHFDLSTKAKVLELIENIRDTTRQMINESNWMDDQTKKNAHKRLDSIEFLVAFPDRLADDKALDDLHKDLIINPLNSVQTINSLTKFTELNFDKFARRDKENWMFELYPGSIKIGLSEIQNYAKIPVTLLQGVTFNKDVPNYINYATLGHMIGHEIMHSLVDVFADKSSEDPNYALTREQFVNKVSCIQDQYNNYTDKTTGLKINGVKSAVENLADNFGLKVAYSAYQKWKLTNGEEASLPGLESFSNEQVFWMAYAMKDCTKYSPNSLTAQISRTRHPPMEFRVIGSASNRPEFSAAYSCPAVSKMNRANKCQIW